MTAAWDVVAVLAAVSATAALAVRVVTDVRARRARKRWPITEWYGDPPTGQGPAANLPRPFRVENATNTPNDVVSLPPSRDEK